MARVARGFACLLVVIAASWGLGSAGAEPGVPAAPSRSARPRFDIPDSARLRHAQTSPSRAVRAVAQGESGQASAAANKGGFLALSGNGKIAPADPTGAAAAAHIFTAVNISYAVYPRSSTLTDPPGTASPLVTGTLESLFPGLPAGSRVFDPKVVYDHYTGRFVLVFLAGHGRPFTSGAESSRLLIASIPDATASDLSTWCLRDINADQVRKDGRQFGDYPGLGFDQNYVYVATNQFGFGHTEPFRYAQILAFGKQRLYDCAAQPKIRVFAKRQTATSGGQEFTIQPAVTESELGLGQVEYLVSFQESSCGFLCGKRLTVWRIKKGRKGLDLALDEIKVPRGRAPSFGTQRDGSPDCAPIGDCWDTGIDLRLVTAFYDADRDRLYTAHAIRLDIVPGDGHVESVIRWYEIDPSPIKRSHVTRTGIIGESGRDSGWPSLATDGVGNLFVTFNRAGAAAPGEYLSATIATIPPGSTTPSATLVLVPGEALYAQYPDRPQRWGDYTAISRDPLDPLDMWTFNQYARSDGVPPSTNLWQQVVNRVSF